MRATFIPSSARRTFAVSVVTALPLAVYSLSNETVRHSVGKVAWLLAAITVATAGSAVIYGLRREVRHARQLGQCTLGFSRVSRRTRPGARPPRWEAAARLERCGLAGEWTPELARAWWATKGRTLAASPRTEVTPSAFTLSRPVVERAG